MASSSVIPLCTTLLLITLQAQATDLPSVSFTHQDWQLVCDNTRTCRAAGYQRDEDEAGVSLLLTRKAGPREPVTAELVLGSARDEEPANRLAAPIQLGMRVDGRALGAVVIGKDYGVGKLSAQQVAAVLAALPRKSSRIEWVVADARWQLSDKGAVAVLLKMDEAQGRLGTQGALIKKGPSGEEAVLPALPAPVVLARALAKPLPRDSEWAAKPPSGLREALRATVKGEKIHCPDLLEFEADQVPLAFTRLSSTQLLVSARCWQAAYNFGSGYWVINEKPPYQPVLVTDSGSDQNDDSISAAHKGRGLGDCWSTDEWVWDGRRYVHTRASTTGLCKMVAAGGTWVLPTIVTEVRRSP